MVRGCNSHNYMIPRVIVMVVEVGDTDINGDKHGCIPNHGDCNILKPCLYQIIPFLTPAAHPRVVATFKR